MFQKPLAAIATLLCCAAAPAQDRAPFIVVIGDLPGGSRNTTPEEASADGTVVVGGSVARGLFDNEAFRWTLVGGIEPLRPLETATGQAVASAISWDGTIITGGMPRDNDPNASETFLWTVQTGAVGLADAMGIPRGFSSGAIDMSPDGSALAGIQRGPISSDGFRWSPNDGLALLGSLPGGNDRSQGLAISADGRVVVGAAVTQFSWRAFRWTAETGMVMIGPLEGPLFAQFASAVSADGTIIAGTAGVNNTYRDGYLWTEAGGFELFGADPGEMNFVGVTDMSADGRVVVGQGNLHTSGNGSWIWDRAHGVRDLHTVLADDYGLDMSDWGFQGAWGISPDGRTIVGSGTKASNGFSEGYVAFLGDPVPCLGDATGDRQVNISDLGVMLTNYGMDQGATESDGDTDNDGDIDTIDLQTLITHFGDLCPL